MTNQILGGKTLEIVKGRCQAYQNYFQRKLVTIILFQAPDGEANAQILSQYEAAVASTNQKVKTFQFLGCNVDRLELSNSASRIKFRRLLQEVINNPKSIGIIVQNPIPNNEFKKELVWIPSQLDIDGLNQSLFKIIACYTVV
jgi:methylenetetrahydrofolate dehydrogenase (NADP+) / methenyltetrahydrofolate cyclohydrolase